MKVRCKFFLGSSTQVTCLKRDAFGVLRNEFFFLVKLCRNCIDNFPVVHAIFDQKVHIKNHILNRHLKGMQSLNLIFETIVHFNNEVDGFCCPLAFQNLGSAVAIWFWILPNDFLLVSCSQLQRHKADLVLGRASLRSFISFRKTCRRSSIQLTKITFNFVEQTYFHTVVIYFNGRMC